MASDKTEQATPRRLEKARSEGNFAISPEILSALYLAAAIAAWSTQGKPIWNELMLLMRQGVIAAFRTDLSMADAARQTLAPHLAIWGLLALGGAGLVLIAIGVQLVQTGFQLAPSKLGPDFGRLNPLSRLRQLPEQNSPQLLRALLLVPLVGLLLQSLIANNWSEILSLSAMSRSEGVSKAFELMRSVLWRATAVLMITALIDLAQKRRRYHADLKMSRHDIREEGKESEGNPQMKAQIRRMMRDFGRRKMMSQVPKATAVIVNPTHYAVAILYVAGESQAPQVIAKGKNYLAARIREVAKTNGVPIVENPPLARSLYRSAEVGQEIPAALYRAVAEVLAYVYRLTNRRFRRGL